MFSELRRLSARPEVFSQYSAKDLWTDLHIAQRMLEFHLDGAVDLSSRNTAFVDSSLEWMIARFAIGADTRVLDLGCGPGLYTNRLALTGASVTGIDFSEGSLAHAAGVADSLGVSVDYVLGNYLTDSPPGEFDLIMMIMGDFCVLSPSERQVLLQGVADRLGSGGRVIFDVYSLVAFESMEESASYGPNLMSGFWSDESYYGFHHSFRYPAEKVGLDRYDIFGDGWAKSIYNWIQYYDTATLRLELASAGLSLESVLGDVAGSDFDESSAEFAVVAACADG